MLARSDSFAEAYIVGAHIAALAVEYGAVPAVAVVGGDLEGGTGGGWSAHRLRTGLAARLEESALTVP